MVVAPLDTQDGEFYGNQAMRCDTLEGLLDTSADLHSKLWLLAQGSLAACVAHNCNNTACLSWTHKEMQPTHLATWNLMWACVGTLFGQDQTQGLFSFWLQVSAILACLQDDECKHSQQLIDNLASVLDHPLIWSAYKFANHLWETSDEQETATFVVFINTLYCIYITKLPTILKRSSALTAACCAWFLG